MALCATQRQEQGDPGITGGDDDVEVTGGQWLGRFAVQDSNSVELPLKPPNKSSSFMLNFYMAMSRAFWHSDSIGVLVLSGFVNPPKEYCFWSPQHRPLRGEIEGPSEDPWVFRGCGM